MIRWPLAIVLMLAGASCNTGNKPEVLYKQAGTAVRRLDLGAALSLCEQGLRRQTSPDSPWFWRFLLLKTEILSSTGRAREALSLLDSPVPQSTPGVDELTARLMMNQGYARFRLSRFEDSLAFFNEAYEKAKQLNQPGLVAEIENKRGQPLVLLLRMPEAEACFRNALDAARQTRDPYLETSALGNLGAARMFAHRYDEAIGFFMRMLPPARQGGYRRVQARATHNLGICSRNLGDLDRALKFYEEAKRLYEATGEQQSLTDLLGDMGNIYALNHQRREATASFRSAADAASRMGNFLYAAGWLDNLAVLSVESGDLDAAGRYLRESLDNLKHVDADAREKASLEPLVTGARIEAARGQFARAESQFRQAIVRAEHYRVPKVKIEARARLGSLYIRKGRWDLAARQLRDLSRTIDSTRSKLRRDEWKLTFQSSVVPFYQDYVQSLMERNDAEHALEAAEACRARVLAEKLELGGDTQTATAAMLREKARRLDAVLLSFWISPNASYLWVVRPDAITPFHLPPEKEITRLVDTWDTLVQRMEDPRESADPVARRLHDVLLGGAKRLIPPGSRVIVVPDGALHGLNLEALVTGDRHPHYWIEDVTVAVAPSLTLLDSRLSAQEEKARGILLIGNPVSSSADFPPLPESKTEIQNIRALFGSGDATVIKGSEARPEAYRPAEPGRFALIHFAAHAVANSESPLDSAVILSKGAQSFKLYARDAAAIPLHAELVTISACRSAGAKMYAGEGLVGFSWAFLRAGARNVIAGLWDASDRATAGLMTRLYLEQTRGRNPAEALRAAKLAMLRDSAYRQPYYWAPFELFTRSAPFAPARAGASK